MQSLFSPPAGWQQTFMHTTLCLHCCTPGDKGYRLTECCQSGLHNIASSSNTWKRHTAVAHRSPGGRDPGGEFGDGLEFPFESYRQIFRQIIKGNIFFQLHFGGADEIFSVLLNNTEKEKDMVQKPDSATSRATSICLLLLIHSSTPVPLNISQHLVSFWRSTMHGSPCQTTTQKSTFTRHLMEHSVIFGSVM